MQNRNTNADTDSKGNSADLSEKQIEYDLLYLAGFGINSSSSRQTTPDAGSALQRCRPDEKCLERYRTSEENMKALYHMSAKHFLDAFVGTTLKRFGVRIPGFWEERIVKAMRKAILFDAERQNLFTWMDREQIWYLPLKGIILKDYYPSVGMRQMSDNDILFDAEAWERVKKHMISEGYEAKSVGNVNHDVYQKPPVYNFEMHRSLYGKEHEKSWVEYFSNIKDRLIPDRTENSCGYHMSDEDFYIYITSHAFKHYSGNGTGVRTLLDFYSYLNIKDRVLDFSYIEEECQKLGIATFEKQNRELCKKVFSPRNSYDRASFEQILTQEEFHMLKNYLSSGVYGTFEGMVKNRMEKCKKADGNVTKISYYLHRIFPGMKLYKRYPILMKHKWLIPAYWVFRIVRMPFSSRRRKKTLREIKIVRKMLKKS